MLVDKQSWISCIMQQISYEILTNAVDGHFHQMMKCLLAIPYDIEF